MCSVHSVVKFLWDGCKFDPDSKLKDAMSFSGAMMLDSCFQKVSGLSAEVECAKINKL